MMNGIFRKSRIQVMPALAAVFLLFTGWIVIAAMPNDDEEEFPEMVGIYIHQHWPYNHPYSARTWTLEDWEGYLDGIRQIGYNTVLIWPILETMPQPLTESDRANLEKISQVIEMAHGQFGMRAYIVLCPNVAAKNEIASAYTFEERPYFYTDYRVDPGDPEALAGMVEWREELFQPLANADGVVIIDSDPGGYPGSGNVEFVYLLGTHRRMLDRLRPGIELYYWIHAGWPAYGRFYQTARFKRGTEEEFKEALMMLRDLNPEPWGVANGLDYARDLGIESRVVNFNYGAIEGEPTFPMTNFGGDRAYEAGAGQAPRGVMGNSQTHCVQLPNTFAFARGAQGRPVGREDYLQFAENLIPGAGESVVRAWEALSSRDAAEMETALSAISTLKAQAPATGPLRGLLFGDAQRFLSDLILQLKMKARLERFHETVIPRKQEPPVIFRAFSDFVEAAESWQNQHGYRNYWYWERMNEALRRLESSAINTILDQSRHRGPGATGFEQVQSGYHRRETYTPRLLSAMKQALVEMSPAGHSSP